MVASPRNEQDQPSRSAGDRNDIDQVKADKGRHAIPIRGRLVRATRPVPSQDAAVTQQKLKIVADIYRLATSKVDMVA